MNNLNKRVLALLLALTLMAFAAVATLLVAAEEGLSGESNAEFGSESESAEEEVVLIPTNVALGKAVTINNDNTTEAYAADGWGLKALTDGITEYLPEVNYPYYKNNAWLGNFYGPGTTEQVPTILTIDLGRTYEITAVNLYPFAGDAFCAAIMPSAYRIEGLPENADATDDEAWVLIAEEEGVYVNNTANTTDYTGERTPVLPYELDEPREFCQIRVVILQDSYTDIGAASNLTGMGEIEVISMLPEVKLPEGMAMANVALGKTATVNNGNTIEAYLANGWGLEALTDGRADNGWIGAYETFGGSTEEDPTILTVDLEGACEIRSIRLYPYGGRAFSERIMPYWYRIDLLPAGMEDVEENWEILTEKYAETAVNGLNSYPAFATTEYVEFSCWEEGDEGEPAEYSKVRIVIMEDSQCDIGGKSNLTVIGDLQVLSLRPISEIETPAPETEAPKTETEAPKAETNAPVESDEETDAPEAETEAPKTETEPPKAETEAPKAETAAPAADTADEGCASVVGMSVVAVLTATAAAVVLKKRD